MQLFWRVPIAAALFLAFTGCGGSSGGSSKVCAPGASVSCTCTDGRTGAQTCQASGEGYGECTCAPGSGGGGTGASAGSSGGAGPAGSAGTGAAGMGAAGSAGIAGAAGTTGISGTGGMAGSGGGTAPSVQVTVEFPKLPDTLMDRSVVIEMKRKAPGERLQKLRRRQREALSALPRRCTRWAVDNVKALSEREPEVPDDLDDRAADNWEPLLAIADQAGGPWPTRARATALFLSGARADAVETGDAGVQLLADVCAIFANTGIDKSTTKALLSALGDLDGRPWAEWNRGRPLSLRASSAPCSGASESSRAPSGWAMRPRRGTS